MRALLIASGIGLSHLNRLLLVGRELAGRDDEVALAAGGDGPLPPGIDFDVTRLPEATVSDFADNVYGAYTPELVEACVRAELELIERVRPDVVVGDFRPTAAISTRLAGVPYVSVVNAYMTDRFDPTDVLLGDGAGRGKRAVTSFLGRRMQGAQKRSLAAPFRDVASAHGIRELDSLYDFLEGEMTLIADLPELCPLRGLPESFRYIGPLVWEPPGDDAAAVLEGVDPSRPLVYATAGNTGARRLIELVLEAFGADSGVEVVLSAGAYLDLPATVPPNVHAARFVPASRVLSRAVATVHCGGNGTTYQALGEGVPAVVVPFNTDQRINAMLVGRNRLGIPLDPGKAEGRHVAAGVAVVRDDPELRAPLVRFQELVRAADAPAAAADALHALARTRG